VGARGGHNLLIDVQRIVVVTFFGEEAIDRTASRRVRILELERVTTHSVGPHKDLSLFDIGGTVASITVSRWRGRPLLL